MTHPTPQPRGDAPSSRDIVIGATVYGVDNARFGQVAGSYRNYLIVERGFFMPVDYYVPMAAIGRVDQDLVVLSVSRDAALTQGWERPPFTSETGQRDPRRPAAGRPASSSGAPADSASRQRTVSTGTSPNGWAEAAATSQPADIAASDSAKPAAPVSQPTAAPTGTAPATPSDAAGPLDSGTAGEVRKESTAISPTTAFADIYAVGTNTDSYEAMADFQPAAPAADAITRPDPEPAAPAPVAEGTRISEAVPSPEASSPADPSPDKPANRQTRQS